MPWNIHTVASLTYFTKEERDRPKPLISQIVLSAIFSNDTTMRTITIKGYSDCKQDLLKSLPNIERGLGIKAEWLADQYGAPVYDIKPSAGGSNGYNDKQLSLILYQLHKLEPFDENLQEYINEKILLGKNYIDFSLTDWFQEGKKWAAGYDIPKAIECFAKVKAGNPNYVQANYAAYNCWQIAEPDNLKEQFKYLLKANREGAYQSEAEEIFKRICALPGGTQKLNPKDIDQNTLLKIAENAIVENKILKKNLEDLQKKDEFQTALLNINSKKIKDLEEQLKKLQSQYDEKAQSNNSETFVSSVANPCAFTSFNNNYKRLRVEDEKEERVIEVVEVVEEDEVKVEAKK